MYGVYACFLHAKHQRVIKTRTQTPIAVPISTSSSSPNVMQTLFCPISPRIRVMLGCVA